jgi:hypothetical protein
MIAKAGGEDGVNGVARIVSAREQAFPGGKPHEARKVWLK